MVVKAPLGERFLNWVFYRKKKVRDGSLFHELDHRRVVDEAIDEAAEQLKEKTKGYRNG
jgi:hypothetical protein